PLAETLLKEHTPTHFSEAIWNHRKALHPTADGNHHTRVGRYGLHRDLRIMAVARGWNRKPGRAALASDASRDTRRPAFSAMCKGWLSWLYSNNWSLCGDSRAVLKNTSPSGKT